MFDYERIPLQGGGCCRFPGFWLEIPIPHVARGRQVYIELVVEALLIIASSLLGKKEDLSQILKGRLEY